MSQVAEARGSALWVVRLLLVCVAIACAAVACRRGDAKRSVDGAPSPAASSQAVESAVLAKLDDDAITIDEFERLIAAMPPRMRSQYRDPEAMRKLLEEQIRFRLLTQEARKRGYDRLPKVQRRIEQILVEEMMNVVFGEHAIQPKDIAQEEVEAYYAENIAEFKRPAQRRAGYALFEKSPSGRAQALATLEAVAANRKDKELFRRFAADLARKAKPKVAAGDLGFFYETPAPGEEGPPSAVRAAVFDLEKSGDVSPRPVETDDGYYVVQLTGVRPALNRDLDDAKSLIRSRLYRRKREGAVEQFVDKLREDASVTEHAELLTKVRIDTKKTTDSADPQ